MTIGAGFIGKFKLTHYQKARVIFWRRPSTPLFCYIQCDLRECAREFDDLE
jgi:hypothetical protein